MSEVWGIGATTAERLYYKGIRTIEDLNKNQHLLNTNQKVFQLLFQNYNEIIYFKDWIEIY